MRKTPYRANNDISQTYNSGTVKIYTVSDGAEPGYQTKVTLSPKPKYSLQYEERALGINRIYLSRQAQAEILRVIRVPRVNISPQDVAITEDGKRYEISTAQLVKDVFPPSLDLSLKKVAQNLEVIPGEMV